MSEDIQDSMTLKFSAPILVCQSEKELSVDGDWHILIDGTNIELPRNEFQLHFELLYKTFYVFNLKYEKTTLKFWNFLESYWFKISNVCPLGSNQKFANVCFKK